MRSCQGLSIAIQRLWDFPSWGQNFAPLATNRHGPGCYYHVVDKMILLEPSDLNNVIPTLLKSRWLEWDKGELWSQVFSAYGCTIDQGKKNKEDYYLTMIITIYMLFLLSFEYYFSKQTSGDFFFHFISICLAETKTHELCIFSVNIVFSVLWDLFQIVAPRVTARQPEKQFLSCLLACFPTFSLIAVGKTWQIWWI